MVFGGADEERLALNEVSLWCGAAPDRHDNPAAREAFAKYRELFWSGRAPRPARWSRTCWGES